MWRTTKPEEHHFRHRAFGTRPNFYLDAAAICNRTDPDWIGLNEKKVSTQKN